MGDEVGKGHSQSPQSRGRGMFGMGGLIRHLSGFLSIGLLATISHVVVATLCAYALPISVFLANFLGFCSAFGLSYLGHARVTFAVEADHRAHLPRFLVAALAGLGVSSAITWIVHDRIGAPFWLAMLCAAIFVPVFNYALLRIWVFVPRRRDQ